MRGQDVARFESQLQRRRLGKTSQDQSGRAQENERERDFDDDEKFTRASRRA